MKLLITGASCGIGQKLACSLGKRGHEIWGLARTAPAPLEPSPFRYSTCDVAVWEQVDQVREAIERDWGRLDGVIHCAGVQGPIGPARTLDPQSWAESLAVNLNGTFYVLRASLELLLKAERRAKVICFSGGGSTSPRPYFTPYAVAKAAVVRLVENLAQEWAELPIDINAIAPGAVNTRMTEEVISLGPDLAGAKDYQNARRQLETGGTPYETYAGLIEFLLQPDSDRISGRLLSALWDPWRQLSQLRDELAATDIFTLRRIVPEDRGQAWSNR